METLSYLAHVAHTVQQLAELSGEGQELVLHHLKPVPKHGWRKKHLSITEEVLIHWLVTRRGLWSSDKLLLTQG